MINFAPDNKNFAQRMLHKAGIKELGDDLDNQSPAEVRQRGALRLAKNVGAIVLASVSIGALTGEILTSTTSSNPNAGVPTLTTVSPAEHAAISAERVALGETPNPAPLAGTDQESVTK